MYFSTHSLTIPLLPTEVTKTLAKLEYSQTRLDNRHSQSTILKNTFSNNSLHTPNFATRPKIRHQNSELLTRSRVEFLALDDPLPHLLDPRRPLGVDLVEVRSGKLLLLGR